MSVDIQTRIGVKSDLTDIGEFLAQHFMHDEPIQMFQVKKEEILKTPSGGLIPECIESGTVLLAHKGDALVGVAIAGEITPEIGKKDLEIASKMGPKGCAIFKMLAYISDRADLCNKLGVSKCLHIHILSVHQNHRCQGIAQLLFKSCEDLGKAKNFPAFSVDCTNFYTSLIAEKCGMTCLSIVNFDEFNEHVGEVLFEAKEPHKKIKSYARLYE